jgi:hypothetical protein
MIIGLDRAFKPEWVWKILRLSTPGISYQELEPQFNYIIEIEGLKSKKNIKTIIRRYYLRLSKRDGKEYFDANYLHELAIKYSFESIKPILLFVLLCKCDIAQHLQEKINLKYLHNGFIDRPELLASARQRYGDRRIVQYAVGYYLTILEHFGIIELTNNKVKWIKKKLDGATYLIKDMILLYAEHESKKEISVQELNNEIAFTYVDLTLLDDVLKEFNSHSWQYQKRLDGNKIIIK